MEVNLKRLTKNGAFADKILALNQQKAYSFGRISKNDIVLFAPTVSKHHCIFHHNSEGLFVEVLKSLAGVVVNGKKYTTGSMVRLYNNDLVVIGLVNKYQVEIKPIVQDFDTKTNFTSDFETNYERIKNEDLSHVNITNESELENATIDKDTHGENLGSTGSFNLEVSTEIKEEIALPMETQEIALPKETQEMSIKKETQEISIKQETQEISLNEIHSSMQITIDEEDLKPLFPLNSTGETLTDPKNIVEISREPETLKLAEFANVVREKSRLRRYRRMKKGILEKSCDEFFKNKVSENPTLSNKQNKTSLIENETSLTENETYLQENETSLKENETLIENDISNYQVSENQSEISKEQSIMLKERNIVSNQESVISVTLIDIPKNPVSNCPSMKKLPSDLENLTEKPKPTIKSINSQEEEVFSCKFCDRKLSSKNCLIIHEMMHSSQRPYRCEKCGMDFALISRLKRHLETHTEERLFTCAICEMTFKSKKDIIDHLRIHSGMNLQTCGICKKIFANKWTLENHMMTHSSKRTFKCKECHMLFFLECDLQKHLESHTNVKQHKCPHCDKIYGLRRSLTSHIWRNHILHKCNMCDKIIRYKFKFEADQEIHPGKRTFVCEVCKKEFGRKGLLSNHMRYWHVARFACNECEEKLPNEYNSKKHLTIHFPKDDKICPDCGYVALFASTLANHRRKHTRERPFKCNVCDKEFSFKSSLKNHIVLQHTGDFPHRCTKCGKGFLYPSGLKLHYISHGKE